jgi:hypothetical protein
MRVYDFIGDSGISTQEDLLFSREDNKGIFYKFISSVPSVNYLLNLTSNSLSIATSQWLDTSGNNNHQDIVESPCGSFDGVGDYVLVQTNGLGTFSLQDFTVKIKGIYKNTTANSVLWSYDCTSHIAPFYAQHIRFQSGSRVYFGWNISNSLKSITANHSLSDGDYYELEVHFESGNQYIMLNGETLGSSVEAGVISYYNQEVWISNSNFGGVGEGKIIECEFINESTSNSIVHYTFTEGSGSTIYDVSGNGNHGSLVTTDLNAFWSQTQDEFHYALSNGFSKKDVRIPSEAEFRAETTGASTPVTNNDTAFANFLKLTSAGFRNRSSGAINFAGVFGDYWTSDASGSNSRNLYLNSTSATWTSNSRTYGFSVRLIVNEDSTLSAGDTHIIDGLTYGVVQSPYTSRLWLDRNLGATQVATSATDSLAYGDLYQWGRETDGHEKRDSSTTETLASDVVNVGSSFITSSVSPYDWTTADGSGGMRQSINSAKIPALSDGTADALGSTISNPANGWNNPPSKLKSSTVFDSNTLMFSGGSAIAYDPSVSNADVITTTSGNSITSITIEDV